MKQLFLSFAIFLLTFSLLLTGCRKKTASPDIGIQGGDDEIPVSQTEIGEKEKEDGHVGEAIGGQTMEEPNPPQDDPEPGWESATPGVWKVLFRDRSGNLISTQEVEDGKDAVPPEVPFDEEFRFVSWDKEYTAITSNRIITALYEKRPLNDPARLRYSEPDESFECALIGAGSYRSDTLEVPTLSPNGARVTSIGEGAFQNNLEFQRLVLQSDELTIEAEAFLGCFHLYELVINAFPLQVASDAFSKCVSVSSIVLGDEIVDVLKSEAGWLTEFSHSVISLTLGKSIDYIDDGFFDSFVKLVDLHNHSKLKIEKGSDADGGVGLHLLEDADDEFHTILQSGAFIFYYNEENLVFYLLGSVAKEVLEEYLDPDELTEDGTFQLPEGCGEDCYDYYVHPYAFYERSDIRDLKIPRDAVKICAYAFGECKNMTSITFAELPREGIESDAFRGATASKLTIGDIQYTFSRTKPTKEGNYWHYSEGIPTVWTEDADDDGDVDTSSGYGPLKPGS